MKARLWQPVRDVGSLSPSQTRERMPVFTACWTVRGEGRRIARAAARFTAMAARLSTRRPSSGIKVRPGVGWGKR